MEKILIKELKTKVYLIKGEKEGKNYKFVAYETELPNGYNVNMTESEKNTSLTKAQKIIFENEIKQQIK